MEQAIWGLVFLAWSLGALFIFIAFGAGWAVVELTVGTALMYIGGFVLADRT